MTFKNTRPIWSDSMMKPNPKRSHHDRASTYKIAVFNPCHSFKQLAALFMLVIIIILPLSNISPNGTRTFAPFIFNSNYLKVQLPTIRERQTRSPQKPTLYFVLEGGEINCGHRYNVVCKFWFFIRCVMLGDYKDVYVVSQSEAAIDEVITEFRAKDTILFSWRTIEGSNHSNLPIAAEILLKKRDASNKSASLNSVRIGIFHIANEKYRNNFPWYSRVDFVLRNYWIPQPPPHVLYVPLAPQYPDSCAPNSLFPNGRSNHVNGFIFEKSTKNCSCGGMSTARARKRKNLWMFSGSLRGSRAQLVKKLSSSTTLKKKGIIKVARAFGGDRTIGSRNPVENPKTEFLNIISESAFVFAPCGNVMETHRIYEAVALGAIPVIQNCEPHQSQFFPLTQLIIGNGTNGMLGFVGKYIGNGKEIDKLQGEVMKWWQKYFNELQTNVSLTIDMVIPQEQRLPI